MKRTASLIATIIILVLVVVFTLQNSEDITVDLFFWNFESSFALVLFITFALGVIAAILALLPLLIEKKSVKTIDQPD